MNKFRRYSVQAIFAAYFLTMSYETSYALWGISEVAIIATCVMGGCCCYQNKQNDTFKKRFKELADAQKQITTDMQTLSSNGSAVSNIVSALSTNMLVSTGQHSLITQPDLQTAYDGTHIEASRRAPAQLLPGAVPGTDLPPVNIPRTHSYRR